MNEIYDMNSEEKYALRFGQVAIDQGFITREQLQEALLEQFANDPYSSHQQHKLIGEILFEKGWLTLHQIDLVLKELFAFPR